ncbi:FAD-dependent oxidoreductase [Aquiflexum gelatinilyticum]|uniref:FAD-dependent oxidoreductase n=1 Tax=Aquiflexum gelatinilyticum TaxID=2961943 RepID=A0A9X2SXK6_9BACT|nr:FAD-dependent oxidoreductase [Aquiflexum gelatinilyticum]MCR9013744.1 FAD-dependent oxidoreductase [Aquiflexum gelatinilyticum]
MKSILSFFLIFLCICVNNRVFGQEETQLLIIGGGASGTSAGIQASRMGVKTVILEETPWLGGMITAAGVSAIDGNHHIPSGIWGEFREKLYEYYGGPSAVNTGWVSNTLFEPSVGNRIFQDWIKQEQNLKVHFEVLWQNAVFESDSWTVSYLEKGKKKIIKAKMLIDATELGDVMASLGYKYYVGMDSQDRFGETFAPSQANDIVQDLTYVVVLKDYGIGTDKTIPKPKGYDPEIFACACNHADPISFDSPQNDCQKMLNYGKLPNGKYMINWPNCGNDLYMNIVEMSQKDRDMALEEAKLHSLRFIYYIQNELGYKHLGLADDEFPTKDQLPFIPYHRESRRVASESMFTLPYVLSPYNQEKPYYRTGIAVGDYTIDHHHKMNPNAPEIDFIKIRVPSYNIPLGSLIPKGSTHFIVAEKSIGVSNIVNGASRLQPVVLGIGQAAGALAGTAILNEQNLQEVKIRNVQENLLVKNAYLMPFRDIDANHPHFLSIQKIGATGILKGFGVPYKWANQTWFYPEREISEFELVEGLRPLYSQYAQYWDASGERLTLGRFLDILKVVRPELIENDIKLIWKNQNLSGTPAATTFLDRLSVAVLLDSILDPFSIPVDFNGLPSKP